jgi:small subunit ribosomal protein S16
MGTKARPFYRIVAAPSSAGRDGRFVEQLGHYDPLRQPALLNLQRERILHWLSNGASPSETLVRLLKKEGLWSEFESTQQAAKQKRKPLKARVRQEKPVKEKKRKPKEEEATPAEAEAPAEEPSEASGEPAEAPAEE